MTHPISKRDKIMAAVAVFFMIFGVGFINWLLGEGGHF
jgi:hypothetical protein